MNSATLTRPVDSAMKHNFTGPLEESIFKATKSNEKSPIKDKHLKLIVSESWRTQMAEAIFAHLLSKRPLASKEVVLFKTLGVTHILLRDGHPSCIAAAHQQEAILKSLQNQSSTTTTSSYSLINNHYISLILTKIKFHITFTGLAGTLGIQEYRDKHRAWNAKFTFAVVQQLLALQQTIINFQNATFASQGLNPCKLSCIIPAIKESHSAYLLTVQYLMTSMIMCSLTWSADTTSFPLNELVDTFNTQYPHISKFYFTCTGIPFITGLMTVPSLSREGPPRFARKAALPSQPKPAAPVHVQPTPVAQPAQPAQPANPDPLLLFGLHANFTPLPPQFTNYNAPPAALVTSNPFMTSNPGQQANPFATMAAAPPVARYASVPQIDPSETREALERKIAELEAKLRQLLAHLKSLEEENARLKAQLSSKDSTASAARIEMELKLKQQQEQAEAAARAIKEHVLQLQQKYEQEKLKLISDQVSFAKNSVHQYLFRFDDPNFAGNRNAMADDILNGTAHLQESFQLLVSTLEDDGDVVGASRLLADHTQKFLADAKGLSNRVEDPDLKLQLTEGARSAGRITAKLLTDAQELSARGKLTPQERDRLRGNQNTFIDNLVGVRNAITNSTKKKDDNNVDSIAERELMKAAKIIADAAASLKAQAARSAAGQNSLNPEDWAAHAAIAESALGITHATQMLLNAAAAAQQERVARGIEKANAGEAYHSDPMWAEGLISAAKAVANSTKILVSSANHAIDGNVDEATLTAACRAVAAHTAKLQQATRVKAEHNSKAQGQLDNAAKLVKDSTNGLVEETKKFSAFEEAQVKVQPTGSGFNNIKAERELEGTIERLKVELQKSNQDLYKWRTTQYGSAHQKTALKSSAQEPVRAKVSQNYSSQIDTTPTVSAFGDRHSPKVVSDEALESMQPSYMKKKLAPVDLAPEKIDLKAKPELEIKPRPLHLQNDLPSPRNNLPVSHTPSQQFKSSSPLPSPASHQNDDDDDLPAYMKKKLAPVNLASEKIDLSAKPELEIKPRPLHLQNDLPSNASLPPPPVGNSNPFGAPPAAAEFNPFGAPPAGNSNPFGAPPAANSNPFGAPLPPPAQQYSSNPWG